MNVELINLDNVLVLLNISPYIPNQVILAAANAAVALGLLGYALMHKSSAFWNSREIQAACLLTGGMALFMTCFILVGYVSPLTQPLINVFSEAGIVASFSIVCIHVSGWGEGRAPALSVLSERPVVRKVFQSAPFVMGTGLLVSLVIAIVAPFPMNTIYTEATFANFLYREAYLTPETFFTAMLVAAYFAELITLSRYGVRELSGHIGRLAWQFGGVLAWFGLCVVHWTVSYLQAYHIGTLQAGGKVFWSLIGLDIFLYGMMGICWLLALTIDYFKSIAQMQIETSREYRLIRLQLQECLGRIKEEVSSYREEVLLAEEICGALGFDYWRKRQTQALVNSLALARGSGIFEPRMMQHKLETLFDKRERLLNSPVMEEDSRGKLTLDEDYFSSLIPDCLELAQAEDLPTAIRGRGAEQQVAVVVGADWGLFDSEQNEAITTGIGLDSGIRAAYRDCEGGTEDWRLD